MSARKSSPVQLEGEELERARKFMRAAEDNLLQLGKIVGGKLNGDAAYARLKVKSARFIFNNYKVVYDFTDSEQGCVVYEDPPGVCRPCEKNESTSG